MKQVLKSTLLLILFSLSAAIARADEGMWMIHNQIGTVYKAMRAEGLKLRPEEIYNGAGSALSDAVVAMNGGMGTGSVISANGLVITNHHVAYDDIHSLSTMEHNYLENGFVAGSLSEELPTKSTVTFVTGVEDITDEALALKSAWEKEGKWNSMSIRRLYSVLETKYAKESGQEVSVSSMWRNEKFYLYYLKTYRDVRLVAAPSVHIGAFGGETDNWGWPQHKCDFAIYRVYTAPDGSPADYSAQNVPLHPRKYLQISSAGVHDGDFTMVIGFPGVTNRYMSSYAVREKQEVSNPIVYASRRARLDVMKRHMEASPEVRLLYSDKYFGLSNYADYARWENICLKRYSVADKKATEEQKFAAEAPSISADYAALLPALERGYAARREVHRNKVYFQELWFGTSEAMIAAGRVVATRSRMEREKKDVINPDDDILKGIVSSVGRFDQTDWQTERDILGEMFSRFVESVPQNYLGAYITEGIESCGGDARAFAQQCYDSSAFTSKEKILAFFSTPKTVGEMFADPLVALSDAVKFKQFADDETAAEQSAGVDVAATEADYQRALYRYKEVSGDRQYPNANSTIRFSYGRVGGIRPSDGVAYDSRTTTRGYFEKASADDYDFIFVESLRKALEKGDWGRWGEKGVMYVDFLSDNDITGGNSGSPVLNARGNLVGLAFDGNRESMAGDIWFHPTMAKTVSADIRFVMWTLENVMGARSVLNELTFTNK